MALRVPKRPLTRSLRGSVTRAGASVIALQLAGACVTARAGLRVVDGLAQERELEATQMTVSRVAAAAREQYVHQAHTLLARDASHLDHYAQSARAVTTAPTPRTWPACTRRSRP